MSNEELKKLTSLFDKYPEIKLVYFFGSKAVGNDGPLSDYDFAFYLNERDNKKKFNIKIDLIGQISRLLKTDKVDVVILNTAKGSELKYNIIKEGKIIFEKDLYRVIVEPKILNEYFDFRSLLLRYNLTQA